MISLSFFFSTRLTTPTAPCSAAAVHKNLGNSLETSTDSNSTWKETAARGARPVRVFAKVLLLVGFRLDFLRFVWFSGDFVFGFLLDVLKFLLIFLGFSRASKDLQNDRHPLGAIFCTKKRLEESYVKKYVVMKEGVEFIGEFLSG